MAEPRVVWILGAGFSRPLGGPLLRDLLSAGSFLDLRERYGASHYLISGPAPLACHVYHYGRAYEVDCLEREPKSRGEHLWSDAEEFLDILDSASKNPATKHTIQRITTRVHTDYRSSLSTSADAAEMYASARLLLAAECSTFAEDASLGSEGDVSAIPERWSAHVAWIAQLNERHTLVTFNYDRAVERMAHHVPNGPIARFPKDAPTDNTFNERPVLLKLHGSVNWERGPDGIREVPASRFGTVPSSHLVIATPGPTKSETTVALEPLWKAAEEAIERADAIVFVGYRFPPTDAIARRRLLRAIEQRAKREETMALHTVLGPHSADAPRLAELLRFAALRGGKRVLSDRTIGGEGIPDGACLVRVHELYSQDFFTVYEQGLLMRR